MTIRSSRLIALGIAGAALALATAGHGEAASGTGDNAVLQKMSGMWEIYPRGPRGRRGPPPGGADGQRFGPPPAGAQPGNFGAGGARTRFGPPPGGGPDDSGEGLPGPDIEGLDRGDKLTYAIMTPAGKAAFDAMDPHELPSNNCKSNGLPSLVGIPDLQDWSFAGDVLTIHYADFNTVRTVHLDGSKPAGPPSLYGYSVGRFANGELTVTTTNLIATPGGLGRNAPGSASRSYVEHYRLSADGTQITGYLTVHDPEYLTRDLNLPIDFARAPAGTEIPDVGCSVEASQRYLDH